MLERKVKVKFRVAPLFVDDLKPPLWDGQKIYAMAHNVDLGGGIYWDFVCVIGIYRYERYPY